MKSKSNYAMEMTADGQELPVKLIAGIVEGAMNSVPLARIEFVSNDLLLDLGEFVGKSMDVKIFGEDEKQQYFCGICVCAEYLGSSSGNGHYLAEIRPWIWFLSRKQDNRIFQNQTTTEIVKNVLSEHGFSANLKTSLSGLRRYASIAFSTVKRILNSSRAFLRKREFTSFFNTRIVRRKWYWRTRSRRILT
ncbi:hypothetical protein RC74_04920 [Falsihalocynthiibacter arcticus]|uniref:Uncharacterized protein n=1 Tax=Falsihalocynthiibacter arcticus TaxID=1579316 RepID=A0A126UXB7_9RHOB|nr:contractile injection system protein, VgrG/Pvc8 family [Falsihalocynthiibacter arcticus]AML50713.1 hypothetical protein RC74_04920 [Falsihalocynthiibacter arcticus]